MNEQNLDGRKGGIASGIARRKKAEARKLMKDIVASAAYAKTTLDKEEAKTVGKFLGKPASEVTVMDVGIYKQALMVQKGDMNGILFFRDMLGEKPADKVTGSVSLDMNFDFVVEPEEEDEGEAEDADGGVE